MTRVIKIIAKGPQGPAGAGSSQTLAQVLANGASANSVEITSGATPTADSSLDTRGARDTAIAALSATYQPLDSDLTAIAALTTTSYGRALLALADAAALRTAAGLGTAATQNTTAFDTAGAAAAAQAASQPLDSDLTAIAALATTSFGRALLALVDAAALRTAAGLGTLATLSTVTTSEITDGTIAAADISATLKPSGSAVAATEALRALGTSASTATAGNDSRLTDSRAPSGTAGGDLTGTYPNPTLGTAGPGATGPIGDATHVPAVTIDAKGRVTALSSVLISGGGSQVPGTPQRRAANRESRPVPDRRG